MPTEFLQVADSAADAHHEGAAGWNSTAAALKVGGGWAGYWQFPIAIPIGAELVQATFEVTGDVKSTSGTQCTVDLIEDFAGDLASDRSALNAEGAGLTWTFGAPWEIDDATPASRLDVTTLVERFLDRENYVTGSLLTLRASGGDIVTPRTAHAADGPGQRARLLLRWHHGVGGLVALRIEDLFADSAVFRVAVEAADRMEALARVHTAAMPATAPRPCVLLEPLGADFRRPLVGTSRRSVTGSINGRFVVEVGTGTVDSAGRMVHDAKRLMVNSTNDWADAVLAEVAALGEMPGYLAVGNAAQSGLPAMGNRDERAKRAAAEQTIDVEIPFRVDFGVAA